MTASKLLLIVLSAFVLARLFFKDTEGETLAGRLAGGQPDDRSISASSLAGSSSPSTSAAAATPATGIGDARTKDVVLGSVTQSMLDSLARKFGWNASEVADWEGVITDESGGDPNAQNPTSSAYGIAQFINGPSEYAEYGGNSNTVLGQLTAMANYIKERYGTPAAALAHENSCHWY